MLHNCFGIQIDRVTNIMDGTDNLAFLRRGFYLMLHFGNAMIKDALK